MTKISSLGLMMWKLDYFSQNIWRGQIGLRTRIFGQFLNFDDLQAFAYLWRKFWVWGSWSENWTIFVRIFEGVRLVLELECLVSFYILMIYKHLLTCDKKFQLETHNMKIDLFLADFESVRLIQEPEFSVSFCIFPTCNNIPTNDKKFEHETYEMKTGLFCRYFFGLCRL